MAINIDTLVHNDFSRSAIDQLEKITGKPTGQIESGVERAVSEVLDGFSLMAKQESGRQTIYEAARYCDDSLIDDPAIFLAGKDQTTVLKNSNDALGSLVGIGKHQAITSAVQSSSGLSAADAEIITGYVTPGVLGVMKRQMLNGAVLDNTDGIGQMLLGETTTATAGGAAKAVDPNVPKNTPRQTTSNVASGGNVNAGANVGTNVGAGTAATGTGAAAATMSHAGGRDLSWLFRYMLPLLLLGGLVLAGLRNCGTQTPVAEVDTVTDQTLSLQAEADGFKQQITTLTAERDEALTYRETAVKEISRLEGELEAASVPVEVDTSALDAANLEIERLKGELEVAAVPVEVDNSALDAANAEIASLKEQLAKPADNGALDKANAAVAALQAKLAAVPAPVDNSNQIMSLQQQVDDSGLKFAQLESELGTVRAKREELEASIAQYRAEKTAAEQKLETATSSLTAQVEEIKGVNEGLNVEIEGLKQSIEDAQVEIAGKQTQIDKLMGDLENGKSSVSELEAARAKLAADLDGLGGERDGLKVEIETLKGDLEVVRGERDELSKSVVMLTDERDNAMKATEAESAKLGMLNTDISGLQDNIATLTGSRDAATAEIKELKGQITSLTAETAKIDGLNATISDLEGDIAKLTEARDAAAAQVKDLEGQVSVLEQQKAEAAGRTDVLQRNISEATDENTSLTSQLAKITKDRTAAIASVTDLAARLRTSESERKALEIDKRALEEAIAKEQAAIQARKDEVVGISNSLADRLTSVGLSDVTVEPVNDSEAVGITMGSSDLYRVGSASLSPNGVEVLGTVGEILGDYPDWRVDIEGHTDGQPIGGALRQKFASNWELSAARASAAVRFLQFKTGIDPEQMSVRGWGQYRPVATNETKEGRKVNRRIEVILRR